MWSEGGTVTFSISDPFIEALGAVRAALVTRGLRVVSELDVARRVKNTLGISLPPCRVLCVWPATNAADIFPAAALFLPLHVVVSARGRSTDISVLSHIRRMPKDIHDSVMCAISRAQTDTVKSLESICMPVNVV